MATMLMWMCLFVEPTYPCAAPYETHEIMVVGEYYWDAEDELLASVGCEWLPTNCRHPEYDWQNGLYDDWDIYIFWEEVDAALEEFEPLVSLTPDWTCLELACSGEKPCGYIDCNSYEEEAYGVWAPICMED